MIRLVSIFGQRLNLNGDQANLTVLAKRLEARGKQYQVQYFDETSQHDVLDQAHFVFIGHGSMAAWQSVDSWWPELQAALSRYRQRGGVVMAVASGAERLYESGWFAERLATTERVSKFVVADLGEHSVLGYRNCASSLPDVAWIQNVLVTALHGPVLAKNPILADEILSRIAGSAVEQIATSAIEKLDANVAGVWRLEADLANQ